MQPAFFLPTALWVSSCSIYQPIEPSPHPLQQNRACAREHMLPLDVTAPSPTTTYMQEYLAFYNLVFEGIDYEYFYGTFESGGRTLVAHVFRPRSPRGTVFAVHGYMDHIGMLRHLVHHCLTSGYTVATFDLPGHGLSSGSPASIDSFSDYRAVLADFIALCLPKVTAPCHLVSHSTGSAISLEYLSCTPSCPFETIVFVAPLIRHVHWHPVKLAFSVGRVTGFKTVARQYGRVSSDVEFLAFQKSDPLQFDRVPAEWIGAMYAWESRIRRLPVLPLSVLVIQGTDDTVVDGPYNVAFLQKKIEDITIRWIDGGAHELFNESESLRAEVLNTISGYLENAAPGG